MFFCKLKKIHFCDASNKTENVCDAQWLLLNTVAVYASETPSPEEKRQLANFFTHFVDRCEQPELRNFIPEHAKELQFDSRRELVLSLCLMENEARAKVGVEPKQCNYSKILQRWRYGDGYV